VDDAPAYQPVAILRALLEGGVDFVVIGGVAVAIQAMPRFTKDLDVCYSTVGSNLDALGEVLASLNARLRGISDEVPFVPDARTLAQTEIVCLTTPVGDIDLLAKPAGAPPYGTLRRRADIVELGGQSIRIASIEDMLAMKRAAGRPQDLADVESLESARRLQRRARKAQP
jgi:hypothetical protein